MNTAARATFIGVGPAIAQPVSGLPSSAADAGKFCCSKSAVAEAISMALSSRRESSLTTKLPFSARPGPLWGRDSSGRTSSRTAATFGRSARKAISVVSFSGESPPMSTDPSSRTRLVAFCADFTDSMRTGVQSSPPSAGNLSSSAARASSIFFSCSARRRATSASGMSKTGSSAPSKNAMIR